MMPCVDSIQNRIEYYGLMRCVHQEDCWEKGHQVAHMRRIYREASRVVIWLGEDHAYPRLRRWLSYAEIQVDILVSLLLSSAITGSGLDPTFSHGVYRTRVFLCLDGTRIPTCKTRVPLFGALFRFS